MAIILVIDDDPTIRNTLRRILERSGHAVLEAADGEMGLRLAREDSPDLVITDIIMPEKEGIETIQELREADPELPIIAISGTGSADEGGPLLDAELFGANATLSKPFTIQELTRMVDEALASPPPSS